MSGVLATPEQTALAGSGRGARETFIGLVVLGAWFGLLASTIDIALRLIQLFVLGERIYLSPQFVWMAPLADVVLYGAIGLLVAALARVLPRYIGVGVLAFACTMIMLASPLVILNRLHIAAVLLLSAGFAYQTARFVRSRPDVFRRIVRWTAAPIAVAVLLSAAGVNVWLKWQEQQRAAGLPAAFAGAPNILLIILDTVRASSLRLYGYERETTPNLDRLAAEAVVFDKAVATAPWTLPSHASVFTGEYPDRLEADWKSPLGPTPPTLAAVLASNGYRTAGFSANLLYATYETGLQRGFTHYTDYPISAGMIVKSSFSARLLTHRIAGLFGMDVHLVQRRAASVTDAFLDWLGDESGDRPFFAFLNYFDAHDPYMPPAPFDTLFGGVEPMSVSVEQPFEGETLVKAKNAYDAEIASIDHSLGVLLDELEARGELDETLIVVVGDHGEHFGEHGLVSHANSLYMPLLHVPLIVRPAGGLDAGRRIDRTVTIADIPATILSLANVAAGALPGTPLVGPGGSEPAVEPRPARSFVSKTINMPDWLPASRGDMTSVTDESLHYIRNGDGSEELYDLAADPQELNDLADLPEFAPELERLRALAAGIGQLPINARADGAGNAERTASARAATPIAR